MTIEEIAKKMVTKGKGILAADESTGTMEKRLKSVNVECTEKNRLHFRETLFSSGSMETCISGVILFDETLRQTSNSGISIPELIKKSGKLFLEVGFNQTLKTLKILNKNGFHNNKIVKDLAKKNRCIISTKI